jgi:hypothetical protein
MSFVCRLLAVAALSAMPVTSSLAASSSASAAGNSSHAARESHRVAPKGPARVPGSQVPGIARSQPMIVPGKSNPKPPSALRTPNGQGFNGQGRGPRLQLPGNVAPREMGGPDGTSVNSRVHALPRGGASPLGTAPGTGGGVNRRPAEINGSLIGTRGLRPRRSLPQPKPMQPSTA